MASQAAAGMTRDQRVALSLLRRRYGARRVGQLRKVGSYVEMVAESAVGAQPAADELRAAICLLSHYFAEVEQVQRQLIAAARATDDNGQHLLTWEQIGLLLGFPPNTAKQRASQLGTRLGIPTTTKVPATAPTPD